jgi:hypothetical protein
VARAEAAAPRGLAARIGEAWRRGFRASMARELADEPGEPRLLAYAMGGSAALGLAGLPARLAEAAAGPEPVAPSAVVVAQIVSSLFFTPLFLYGVAALMRLALRAAGGTGDWRATRVAVFWSLVLAAPAILLAGGLGYLLAQQGVAPALAALPPQLAGLLWLWIWSAGLAEAHGFRSGWPIFALVAALALGLLMLEPGALGPGGG